MAEHSDTSSNSNQQQQNNSTENNAPRFPRTSCLPCRLARQRCDRKETCSRCASHGFTCEYPLKSNRGRKRGSTNKPVTVEKLLSQIAETTFEHDLRAALLSRDRNENTQSSIQNSPGALSEASGNRELRRDLQPSNEATSSVEQSIEEQRIEEPEGHVCSPLHILAAAVTAPRPQPQQETNFTTLSSASVRRGSLAVAPQASARLGSLALSPQPTASFWSPFSGPVAPFADGQLLARYFASKDVDHKDWDILTQQPLDSPFRFDPKMCDPIAAGLLSEQDSNEYFALYFQFRNPLVGLMDQTLHTPTYIHSASFTLFSVICALGSAVSTRPRDRLLSPLLYTMAEQNIKWSILSSVKSLETIQAIMNITYWALAGERYSDDPSWLRLGHAVQLAREIGIQQASTITRKVNLLQASTPEERERFIGNYQRTWLFVFIMDKGFGITTGRAPLFISWKEISPTVGDWWRRSTATPSDRVTSAIVEMRIMLLRALEDRRKLAKTETAIIQWQQQAFESLGKLRDARCASDNSPSARYLAVLAFYIDHGLLVINVHASKALVEISQLQSTELNIISQQTLKVALRLLELFLFDELLVSLVAGLQNMQLIMISHAATEIFHAIKSWLPPEEGVRAADKIRMTTVYLEKMAKTLPATSWASLYLDFFRFLQGQLEGASASRRVHDLSNQQEQLVGLWNGSEENTFDFGFDSSLFELEPPLEDNPLWDF